MKAVDQSNSGWALGEGSFAVPSATYPLAASAAFIGLPKRPPPAAPFAAAADQFLMRGLRKPVAPTPPTAPCWPLAPKAPPVVAPVAAATPPAPSAVAREWRVIYRKPPTLLERWMGRDNDIEGVKGNTETQIDRYEMKYLVHASLVPEIRAFIAPFVDPDKNTTGDPPSYTATTLQIDSINSTLHYAKQREVDARFKLRIRTYGFDGKTPYFFELKRKLRGKINKSRAVVSARDYCKELVVHPTKMVFLKDASEQMNLLEFIRLTKAIGGIPAVYLRYERECYAGHGKEYARVTFDRNMRYRPAMNSWVFPLRETKWYQMDSATAQGRDFSGSMLELKSTGEAPHWMLECVERFNLVPAGHCKFSMAMNSEALFRGHSFSEGAEDTTPFETAAD
ncbi:MAG: polyphosphate polymerase domain-containing protein [Verrucomicrobiota bacterium]